MLAPTAKDGGRIALVYLVSLAINLPAPYRSARARAMAVEALPAKGPRLGGAIPRYDELDEIFRGKGDNDTVAWCSVRRSCQPGQSLGPNRAEHAVLIV